MTVQNVSLPEELQKILDQKIGMGMVGNDMGKFMQYQTAQAIPKFAEGARRWWRRHCRRRHGPGRRRGAGPGAGAEPGRRAAGQHRGRGGSAAAAVQAAGVKPEDVMATLEKLGELKAKGILTAGRVRRQEGRAAEEAGLIAPIYSCLKSIKRPTDAGLSQSGLKRHGAEPLCPWLTSPPPSGTTARPAPAAARRWSSAARSRRTRSAATARAPWCARARCCRASARWPSCSTTTACCSSWPAAPSMARASRWSAGCSTATAKAPGPNGRRC